MNSSESRARLKRQSTYLLAAMCVVCQATTLAQASGIWSPNVIALALAFYFGGTSGVRNLLGLLFRGFSENSVWYLIGILVPAAAVAFAIAITRHLHSGAAFLPLAALPLTLGLQVFTGAMGEELGWRGFLLSHLDRKLSPRAAALVP
jgi:membrane protease YdiL (CAAX protease family)